MRTRAAAVAVVAFAATAFLSVTPASAKGPSEGTIDGPGIEEPISIGYGEGTPGGDRLIEDLGFFPAAFETRPDPMLDEAPAVDLGPAFTVRWSVPGPNNEADDIVQVVYPYAEAGPLVYTEPGQSLFTTERTRGGWYLAPERVVVTMQELGVPTLDALEALEASGSGTRWAPIGASLAAMVLLGVGLVAVSRKRGNVAPATT